MPAIQSYLRSTWELLSRAFPSGIPSEQYLPLLFLLYPHLADENLMTVIAEFTRLPAERVLNDIYTVGSPTWSRPVDDAMWTNLQERLARAEFDAWVNESE